MKPANWCLAAVCILITSCGGRLGMVGYNRFGNPTEAYVDENKYSGHVTDALLTLEETVQPVLERADRGKKWELRTAVFGFGVKAEVGIGPFKVAFRPRIRGAFGKGKNPPIP